MKVLVIGSGGREHTLAEFLKKSPSVTKVFSAPGNPGMEKLGPCADIKVDDFKGLADYASEKAVDLTVVGPEVPLTAGITDYFSERGLTVFGPDASAARIEGSKKFAKKIMKNAGIPTGEFRSFKDYEEAEKYIKSLSKVPVLKADGLAAGKGVIVAETTEEALKGAAEILKDKKFGAAGNSLIVEERLFGEEASIFAVCDGADYLVLPPSQDHKRIFDGDKGPNTGGMGAYCPAPAVTPEILAQSEEKIIRPLLKEMKKQGCEYRGLLYAGIILTKDGPKVIEFNCRFGDPETQCVVPMIDGDLGEILLAAAKGSLQSAPKYGIHSGSCVCVVAASEGYPESSSKGDIITGTEQASALPETYVIHAGTKNTPDGLCTAGGRVLGVVSRGKDLPEALERCYAGVGKIKFRGMQTRKDIGAKGL
ncbi:MAG: phosphoribosylamine--glycine ligase [Fibrobacterota bacterium]